MTAVTKRDDLGHAVKCEVAGYHRPIPLRFVWHHVQPEQAGGPDDSSNLIQVCDNCHYGIHRVLFALKKGQPIPPGANRRQVHYARAGYSACVATGNVAKIPNEG